MKQQDSYSALVDFHKQGNTDKDTVLTDLDEIRTASVEITAQALRNI